MSGKLRLYIRDNNNNWADFTDRFHKDRNGLESIGAIKRILMEGIIEGTFETSLTNIKMDNSDYFWDSTVGWDSVQTTNGNTASFSTTKNGYEIDLKGNWIKLIEFIGDNQYLVLGLFRIKQFSTYLKKGVADIKLKSVTQYLKEKSAKMIKDGKGWYINRPITFLLKELLKDLDEDLFSFDLPGRIKTRTVDDIRVFSQLGTPPQQVKYNLYNPLYWYPFALPFSDQFLNISLEGKLG